MLIGQLNLLSLLDRISSMNMLLKMNVWLYFLQK